MSQKPLIDVRVNADEIIAALARAESLRGFKLGLAAAGAMVLARTATYPPQKPGSQYQRTGNLGRRWTMQARAGGLQVVIGNNADYAPDVQGNLEQTPFFRERGWLSPATVAERDGAEIAGIVNHYVGADL